MDYKDINDYELIFLVKEENEYARNLLINKYSNLINKVIDEMVFNHEGLGLDRNDLFQEGMVALSQAVDSYNEFKNASFYTYALICIRSKIKSVFRKANSQKNYLLNSSVSLDTLKNDFTSDYYDIVSDYKGDLCDILLEDEENDTLINSVSKLLTPFEKIVFEYKLNNYSNEEISKLVNKDKRSVENALFRIRSKYKKVKVNS